ncbi:hypothetical protein XANCAGTX0491_005578 [Xanthoria calcicola]
MAAAPFDVLTTTASELEILLASGEITSAQLIEVYLAEIEKNNGYLKAVICTAPKDSLIEKANALDRERSSGTTRSHLHGLPMLVKVGFTLTIWFGRDLTEPRTTWILTPTLAWAPQLAASPWREHAPRKVQM